MSDKPDIFTEHYSLLRRDANARQHLIDDPIAALKEYFGSMPEGNYRVEVISEQPDTITIVLPVPPVGGDPTPADIDASSKRIYDMLFTDGIGGCLIPDETLTWTLRDMRAQWAGAAARKDEK